MLLPSLTECLTSAAIELPLPAQPASFGVSFLDILGETETTHTDENDAGEHTKQEDGSAEPSLGLPASCFWVLAPCPAPPPFPVGTALTPSSSPKPEQTNVAATAAPQDVPLAPDDAVTRTLPDVPPPDATQPVPEIPVEPKAEDPRTSTPANLPDAPKSEGAAPVTEVPERVPESLAAAPKFTPIVSVVENVQERVDVDERQIAPESAAADLSIPAAAFIHARQHPTAETQPERPALSPEATPSLEPAGTRSQIDQEHGTHAQEPLVRAARAITSSHAAPVTEPSAETSHSEPAQVSAFEMTITADTERHEAPPEVNKPHAPDQRRESPTPEVPPPPPPTAVHAGETHTQSPLHPNEAPAAAAPHESTTARTPEPTAPKPVEPPHVDHAPKSGELRHLSVRVTTEQNETINVRMVQRPEGIDVGVRASDPSAAAALRRDLPELVGGLHRAGFRSEVMSGISSNHTGPDVAEIRRPIQESPAENSNHNRARHGAEDWIEQRNRKHRQQQETEPDEY